LPGCSTRAAGVCDSGERDVQRGRQFPGSGQSTGKGGEEARKKAWKEALNASEAFPNQEKSKGWSVMAMELRTRVEAFASVVTVCACVLGLGCGSALAAASAPGWEVTGRFGPTALQPGGEGRLVVYVYNVGAASGSEGPTVVDTLPTGLEAREEEEQPGCEGTTVVTCKVDAPTSAGRPDGVVIPVRVAVDVTGEGVDRVTVSGGGASGSASASIPAKFGLAPAGLGFAAIDGWFTNVDGTVDTQAGSHPYAFTLALAMNNEGEGVPGLEDPTGGEAHDIAVNLPPGLVGNSTAIPQCTRQQFDEGEGGERDEPPQGCPVDTQVGVDVAELAGLGIVDLPIHNLVPPRGVAAQFGFTLDGINAFLDAGVRSGGDNGITEHVDHVPQRAIIFNSATIWGVPAEASHDTERRGVGCVKEEDVAGCGSGAPLTPFLTLPTSCGAPQEVSAEILGTWQEEKSFARGSFLTHNSSSEPIGFTGCERLVHFEPSMAIAPDTSYADTPAGLSVDIRMPQGVNPEGLATAGLENAKVTLPEGLVINPGQAAGLVACQPSQEDLGGESEGFDGPPSCPAASKVGTDEISTPLLPDKLQGNIYTLQSNPPHLQLLLAASGDGVNIKLVGNVELNPLTGQLTSTFSKAPDTPFTEFKLDFSGGAQAALATPTACGVYESSGDFTPWSSPLVADALLSSSFAIESGPNGSPCASPLPFAASLTAGSSTDQADGYTDFSMLLSRGDDQQRISSLQFTTPEGLLAMISSVPLCGEPQAALGTCPAASHIGHTVVTSGPGPYPLVVPQPGEPEASISLTGPYDGAPYGLSIAVPVIAGPFNLGTEVVRAKIEVNRRTSQVTITTGKLPGILDGIPTDLRSIYAVIDRPGFMFNPSDCSPMAFTGTAVSAEGATAALSSPFQVGSCQSLKFKPDFKVTTSGRTSKANGASLAVKILYPTTGAPGNNQASSQANIAKVKVELPKRLPSRLTTLQKACRAAVFTVNPANCPPQSAVGHASASTPVLSGPVSGPVYFVSHGGEAFPSLIAVLQGQGITVELEGTTFISKQGITTSTFKAVPDVPISGFELTLPQGPYSALAANGNLCKGALEMPTEFVGHNGAVIDQETKITVEGCSKKKTRKITRSRKKPGRKH
jgi:hypothetical protein